MTMTEVEKYNATNLALLKDEAARLEADLRVLREVIALEEQVKTPVEKLRLEWHLGTAAAKIREKRLLNNRKKCHILQISPRRYSVIRLASVLGQDYCEFEVVKHNLEWKQAKLYAQCENVKD